MLRSMALSALCGLCVRLWAESCACGSRRLWIKSGACRSLSIHWSGHTSVSTRVWTCNCVYACMATRLYVLLCIRSYACACVLSSPAPRVPLAIPKHVDQQNARHAAAARTLRLNSPSRKCVCCYMLWAGVDLVLDLVFPVAVVCQL